MDTIKLGKLVKAACIIGGVILVAAVAALAYIL